MITQSSTETSQDNVIPVQDSPRESETPIPRPPDLSCRPKPSGSELQTVMSGSMSSLPKRFRSAGSLHPQHSHHSSSALLHAKISRSRHIAVDTSLTSFATDDHEKDSSSKHSIIIPSIENMPSQTSDISHLILNIQDQDITKSNNQPTVVRITPSPPKIINMASKLKSASAYVGYDVYLNIYDLTWAPNSKSVSRLNTVTNFMGVGAYHSGVEILGAEFAYGGHADSSTGVFGCKPREAPKVHFRTAIHMGKTHMSRSEIKEAIMILSEKYPGNQYNLLGKNCNDFAAELCKELTGQVPPRWINRMAKIGKKFSYCLPKRWKSPQCAPVVGDFVRSHSIESSKDIVQVSASFMSSPSSPSEYCA